MDCQHTQFEFVSADDYQSDYQRLNSQCVQDTGSNMQEKRIDGIVLYECKGYETVKKCASAVTPREKLEPITMQSKSGGTLPSGRSTPNKIAGRQISTVQGDVSVISECYKSVEDYLAMGCKKCIKHWESVGEGVCSEEIVPYKGYLKSETSDVVFNLAGEPDYTPIKISAKDGHFVWLNCDGACADFDAEDSKNCVVSGGEWRYSNSKKAYECHCGTIGSYTERHMALTRNNTCECEKGYVLIDENFPKKGCRLGSDEIAIDNVIQSVNKLQSRWDSMNTKVKQCESAAKNVIGARTADLAEKSYNQTSEFAQSAVKLANEAKDLYDAFKIEYNNLNASDKSKVAKDKSRADTMLKDANAVEAKVAEAINKARFDLATVIDAESQKAKPTSDKSIAHKCVDSHGDLNGDRCSCDPEKNLKPTGNNTCECKTVGKIKYEWHEKCKMCRAPSAVDKDLDCY